jgi:hypothetical protein
MALTEPVEIALVDPVDIASTEPVEMALTDPVEIASTEPVEIALVDPVEIACADPVEIASTDPVDIALTDDSPFSALTAIGESNARSDAPRIKALALFAVIINHPPNFLQTLASVLISTRASMARCVHFFDYPSLVGSLSFFITSLLRFFSPTYWGSIPLSLSNAPSIFFSSRDSTY